MTTASGSGARRIERIEVSRIAASGVAVELTLPRAVGEQLRWYGTTRLTGPRVTRQFSLAPAGEHRTIPTTLLPGARRTRRSADGYDALVFEARDRSDSALVLVGPFHEATTWFGGPAPDGAGIDRLLRTIRFSDGEDGATLVPATDLLRQPDVVLIGRGVRTTLVVRPATETLPVPPRWAGSTLPDGEVWRARRADGSRGRLVTGGPQQWHYVHAGPSVAIELVLLGAEPGRPALPLRDEEITDAFSVLTGRWAA